MNDQKNQLGQQEIKSIENKFKDNIAADMAEEGEAARETAGSGNVRLLQLGVIGLSLVSFYTPANGMGKYIFSQNYAIAYASSAAIQGILLAMSMNMPGYLDQENHRRI